MLRAVGAQRRPLTQPEEWSGQGGFLETVTDS